ncbi:MAG: lysostaphin resistance A-like protein [Syntrophales bacterium]
MGQPVTKRAYLIGLAVIFFAAYGQYFIVHTDLIANVLLVYGLPIFIISWISGKTIIRRAFQNNRVALKYGLGSFGVFTLAGTLAAAGIFAALSAFDPSTLKLLHRANPVLRVSPDLAWMMVAASFLVIGPAEEYIFRGFVFGGLLRIYQNHHWLFLAFVSAALFAGAHLYYFLIYGMASLIPFVEIVAIGMAMAVTYYYSGGNLLIPALLHGAFDAAGFIASDISPQIGIALRQLMILTGVFVAFGFFTRRRRKRLF